MASSFTDTLCTRCGLCCDGSLFADVELTGRVEATGLEVMGLDVEEEDGDAQGGLLMQPCGALQGKRCDIYAHRPECCRTFECRLLQDARRGAVSVEQAMTHIAEALRQVSHVREQAAELGQRNGRLSLKERCVEALAISDDATASPALSQKRTQLEAEMATVEHLVQTTFLGGGA